ncbi:MAG TPA: thiamine phosphate synthase [Terriglobales bacterium]|nr:thiamine phosphate synthase [Terriglobales bacterium]
MYAIVDVSCLRQRGGDLTTNVLAFARELAAGGVTLLQYRNKDGSGREILSHARELKRSLPPEVRLIMNDRADLCRAAAFAGVHIGQDDLSPEAARAVIGPDLILGVSTHNPEQLRAADASPANYVAIGPVFTTGSKANPDPVVGVEGVRRARALTRKPLVAIGGITLENFRSVLEAGADSAAVISALLPSPRAAAQQFLALRR